MTASHTASLRSATHGPITQGSFTQGPFTSAAACLRAHRRSRREPPC